ncbi:helix-turn-helix domain-containing protein [Herbiconiux sp. UC225_62]|uniref:helix-turn-helix domain-containing protein n=1 Tax=Herbiconiux sp. UC225_62 TaxID=3350168 RepID=UPI0036D43928
MKAELARRDLSGHDLAEPLRLGRNAVYARLRGERPFDMHELALIVEFLGISLDDLFASADLGKRVAA